MVEAVILARLARPDALAVLVQGDPEEVERARAEVETLTARLQLAADQYADGVLTGEQLVRITGRLRPQIERAGRRVAANMPAAGVADLVGGQAETRWAAASLDTKRAVIEMLCVITILPTGPGKRFQPECVRIDWRTGDVA